MEKRSRIGREEERKNVRSYETVFFDEKGVERETKRLRCRYKQKKSRDSRREAFRKERSMNQKWKLRRDRERKG